MHMLALQASPRKRGNTATLLDSFLKGADCVKNVSIERVFLHEKKIKPCKACDKCQQALEPKCVIKDDMDGLYLEFLKADMLVLATPVYWWSMSAQLKLFIDRMYALTMGEDNSNLAGKRIILLTTYGGDDPNSGPELLKKTFEDIAGFTGMKLSAFLGVCTGKVEVAENREALEKAFELGKKMATE